MPSQSHENQYALHLTNLGENQEVLASEDIYNQNGVLLVKKGAPINKRISEQIIKFKLLKPIESTISIADSVTPERIYHDLCEILQQYPSILKTHHQVGLENLLRSHVKQLTSYPLILQKLTVMREQLNQIYRNTITVTWLSLAIAQRVNRSPATINDCFFAAICHDFGMLHISAEVINKTDSLTPEEWRQIQSHTVIGQKLVQNIPKLNNKVARIVLEHHERCDGTGYPMGKSQDKLTFESQIIAFCDSLVSVYNKKHKHNGGSIRDLMPFMQVNSESHFYATYAAMCSMIKLVDFDEQSFVNHSNIEMEIDRLKSKGNTIVTHMDCLNALMQQGVFANQHKILSSAQTILNQVTKIVRGSGVLDEGYLRWLEQVKSHKLEHAYREIADVSLMLDELFWHLERVIKILNSYIHLGPESDAEVKQTISAVLKSHLDDNKSDNLDDYAIA